MLNRDLLAAKQYFQSQQMPQKPQQLAQYLAMNNPMEYEEEAEQQPMEEGDELAEEAKAKRAQTFVRFGKRAQTFVRFGKRAQTFVRFGRGEKRRGRGSNK
jgi:hypothetical protein